MLKCLNTITCFEGSDHVSTLGELIIRYRENQIVAFALLIEAKLNLEVKSSNQLPFRLIYVGSCLNYTHGISGGGVLKPNLCVESIVCIEAQNPVCVGWSGFLSPVTEPLCVFGFKRLPKSDMGHKKTVAHWILRVNMGLL